LFCDYLSSEEGLKEFSELEKVLSASVPGSGTAFTDFVSAMQMLSEIKMKNMGTKNLSTFLSENRHRELISAKILSQKWTENNFDPVGDKSDVQNLIFDLLVRQFLK